MTVNVFQYILDRGAAARAKQRRTLVLFAVFAPRATGHCRLRSFCIYFTGPPNYKHTNVYEYEVRASVIVISTVDQKPKG